MRRRDLSLAVSLLLSRSAMAQRRTGIARIGYLSTRSMETPDSRAMVDSFQSGMREHGYVVGRDISHRFRGAKSRIEQLPRALASWLTLTLISLSRPTPWSLGLCDERDR